MFRALILALSVVCVYGQLKSPGVCDPSVKAPPVADVTPFAGKLWYLVETLGNDWDGGSCPLAVTKQHPSKPQEILVTDRQFVQGNKHFSIARDFVKAKEGVEQNLQPFTSAETGKAIYQLLDTDAVTYSLLYTCVQNTPDTKTVYATIYSTSKTLEPAARARLDATINKFSELKSGPWKIHDHSNC